MLANESNFVQSQFLKNKSKQIDFTLSGNVKEVGFERKLLELKEDKSSTENMDDAKTNFLSEREGDSKTILASEFGEVELFIDGVENINDSEQITITTKITNINFTYVGEVKNGKRNGFGYCQYKNGDYFTGEWKDDKMNGLGKLKLNNGETFEGEFKDSHPDGFIIHTSPKAVTRCIMKGFNYADGVVINEKKDKYIIEATVKTKDNKTMGFGVINDFCGNLYEGEMLNFTPFGWGIQHKKGKYVYKGQQEKGFHGYGEVYCGDGTKYFGFFKNNKKHGVVINFNVKEERISFAKYKEDAKNGASLNVYKSGLKVEIWHDGFIVKSIENYDLAKKYIDSCYPEHAQILTIDYMKMINYFGKLSCK